MNTYRNFDWQARARELEEENTKLVYEVASLQSDLAEQKQSKKKQKKKGRLRSWFEREIEYVRLKHLVILAFCVSAGACTYSIANHVSGLPESDVVVFAGDNQQAFLVECVNDDSECKEVADKQCTRTVGVKSLSETSVFHPEETVMVPIMDVNGNTTLVTSKNDAYTSYRFIYRCEGAKRVDK